MFPASMFTESNFVSLKVAGSVVKMWRCFFGQSYISLKIPATYPIFKVDQLTIIESLIMQWVLLLVSLTILLQIPATAPVFTLDQFTSVRLEC